jgi:hypothetical protein
MRGVVAGVERSEVMQREASQSGEEERLSCQGVLESDPVGYGRARKVKPLL